MKRRQYSEKIKTLVKEVLPDMPSLHRAVEQGGNEQYIKHFIESEIEWYTKHHTEDAKRVEIANEFVELLKEFLSSEKDLEFGKNKLKEAQQIVNDYEKSYTDKINSINTLLNLFLEESHC